MRWSKQSMMGDDVVVCSDDGNGDGDDDNDDNDDSDDDEDD